MHIKFLSNGNGDLQCVDRIQSKAIFIEHHGFGIDVVRLDILQIEGFDNEASDA